MNINRSRPDMWKEDVVASVRLYNSWFLAAAPEAYRVTRAAVVDDVENLFHATNDMRDITPEIIMRNPAILSTLRMSTAPPIARDRLMGLSYAPGSLVKTLEDGSLPKRMARSELLGHLNRMCDVFDELLDRTLFDWLDGTGSPDASQRELAAVVVSDRRCGAVADPIVRNAQEARQLAVLGDWLGRQGYVHVQHSTGTPIQRMSGGTYAIHQNVPVTTEDGRRVNMPVDVVIQPRSAQVPQMPILVEAKSAGDFTNTNKRRKEEATKHDNCKPPTVRMFVSSYFFVAISTRGIWGYEAADGIDWVWEHRVEDFALAGV